ncbi:FO synthase [Sinorhizobium meliloti]|uniref:5-amino-6-(D-ribitylamino)uracil--L-tyrosine 4-hydroxyphenyl transferase CofH n=1 Tax=Rhizobium meliloti TaxID=382 RepID=UPI000FDBA29F|nr:5-amino-6-(D-ribitylamino)uracil--L-tyrosine 4-hydroxyphenyl transferase CofH [Sinorhizobium meliloti]MDW9565745.1 5-amino-6-(D-ribitylamino)uracil--L-tyrosine 4-hydroxyphenyl transferase CofH [Sinorhizobium meliloti]MDX0161475.1 5-amino-6-(D-ribitylamino)uracil--L-tyrosine 4-hydroxyphenyl transferase CofH [Sinorhizobium meliloti]MDX0299731.1 5-amino-6-(D-ribitylamino)uracil--L-tyrosine 4-hydroxyphenyl transferase CofH [Sinorhizobium meliloti]MDX0311129.1 5-amino-6-(D-ribitylamino)uracil--L-
MTHTTLLANLDLDRRLSREQALSLVDLADIKPLLDAAARRRDAAHGAIVSYSRKVFIPLTQLCRDVCHYCTFAHPPRKGEKAFLTREQVVAIAEAGKKAGCKEALFTLGDKPELRYRIARDELRSLGHETTLSYLAEVADLVLRETGLLPHVNPGLLSDEDFAALRPVSISQGIMVESTSERLCAKGGAHHGSPDKLPAARLDTIRRAGEHAVPFTSGILIGIGETREERIDSLLALRDLNDAYGHIQEIIVQNFRPKPGTRMADVEAPPVDDHLWTIAIARLIFEPEMNIQAPPNLSPGALKQLVHAGINDWGGVSPVTPDHVNPEAPWPHVKELEAATKAAGKDLAERLALYPAHARHPLRWVDEKVRKPLYDLIDADGWPRTDRWCPGRADPLPPAAAASVKGHASVSAGTLVQPILEKALGGMQLGEAEIVRLFRARGDEFTAVCRAADDLRRSVNGDVVSYVVTRNINYTNICYFKCQFCAFSKGKLSENLRGKPYDIGMDEVARRVREAWDRGASEVCMQGGIHPSYTGRKYLEICAAVKAAVPDMHLHAFSPLEVWQGARTLGISVAAFLTELKAAGLKTLPGTAAEILDDEVRALLCADKINTGEWLQVMRTAHDLGFRSTATIMFGHIDRYEHWARHLIRVRDLQMETGGFTEFVPLPFVHMEAPIYLKGRSRPGPTFRESILMHAVARLALHPHITNIQASWVKLGPDGVRQCLDAGVNDLGGTLMDESISRSAGAGHGQEMTPQRMEEIIRSSGRLPRQRDTLYGNAPAQLRERSLTAARQSQAAAATSVLQSASK